MDNLIKALTIFRKYGNPAYPTHCEHDIMYVMIDPITVSEEDKATLDDLGFRPDNEMNNFSSYVFGSA
jgi:hypothetical protein